jgi:hypothetical protein
MHNKCDFFQEQIKKCNGLAERASDKTDREFWLGMARRWEGMLEAGERGTLNVEVKPRCARYSRNEVAGGAPPDRGRLIAAVVAIARGKRLPAARGCRASSTPQALAADAPHAFVGDAGS